MADEPFGQSPFVLEEQDASEFRKSVRAVLKGAEDCFPVGNSERDDAASVVVGVFEDFGCVVEPFGAEALGDSSTRRSGTGRPARSMSSIIHVRGPGVNERLFPGGGLLGALARAA